MFPPFPGIIVGVIIRYAIPTKPITSFTVTFAHTYDQNETTAFKVCNQIQNSLLKSTGHPEEESISFAIGETVALKGMPKNPSEGTGDTLFCSVTGKSFVKEEEAVFQDSVSIYCSVCDQCMEYI